MDSKKVTLYIILVSLAFAIAILMSSYMLSDTDYAETAMFILIAIWFIPFTYLINKDKT